MITDALLFTVIRLRYLKVAVDALPAFKGRLEWYLVNRPDLAALISRWHEPGSGERRLISLT